MNEERYSVVDVSDQSRVPAPSHVVRWNNPLLVTLVGLMVGTGGVANAGSLRSVSPSSDLKFTVCTDQRQKMEPEEDFLIQGKLAAIQQYLALNVTQLSQALGVTRPTVYAWLKAKADPQPIHLARIQRIYSVARRWRAMSSFPMGQLLTTVVPSSGKSLMDVLIEDTLSETETNLVLAQLKLVGESVPRRKSIADVARSHSLQPVQVGESLSRDELDL